MLLAPEDDSSILKKVSPPRSPEPPLTPSLPVSPSQYMSPPSPTFQQTVLHILPIDMRTNQPAQLPPPHMEMKEDLPFCLDESTF